MGFKKKNNDKLNNNTRCLLCKSPPKDSTQILTCRFQMSEKVLSQPGRLHENVAPFIRWASSVSAVLLLSPLI